MVRVRSLPVKWNSPSHDLTHFCEINAIYREFYGLSLCRNNKLHTIYDSFLIFGLKCVLKNHKFKSAINHNKRNKKILPLNIVAEYYKISAPFDDAPLPKTCLIGGVQVFFDQQLNCKKGLFLRRRYTKNSYSPPWSQTSRSRLERLLETILLSFIDEILDSRNHICLQRYLLINLSFYGC